MKLNIIDDYGLEDERQERYDYILSVIKKILELKYDYDLSVSFVSEKAIQDLNKDYRGIDKVTDVISFALMDDEIKIHGLEDELDLGDIFICVDQAKRQASDLNQSIEKELEFLFIHGVLHLLGYDHMTEEDEETMFSLQRSIVDEISA